MEKSDLNNFQILNKKQTESPLPIDNLPFPFGPFLDECWAIEPDKRPPMSEVVKIMHQIALCSPPPTQILLSPENIIEYSNQSDGITKTDKTLVKTGVTVKEI